MHSTWNLYNYIDPNNLRFGPYFCEPIVAGLTDENKPFLSGMDLIGAPVFTDDYVVSGTCTPNLHGMCESLYRKDMVRLLFLLMMIVYYSYFSLFV